MLTDTVSILAVLVGLIAVSEWLARSTWLRHLGAALLVILLTAIATNVGIIPPYGADTPVYRTIFGYVAPLGIFWLLLLVDLKSVLRVGTPTLLLFLVGALGTALGVFAGHWVVGGEAAFGELHAALAGMFTGTYIGGSVNFNAIAIEYDVIENPALYAGAAAVDNAMTTVWMIACVALPRLLAPFWPDKVIAAASEDAELPVDDEIETTTVFDMSIIIGLGLAGVALSEWSAAALGSLTGVGVPSTLILTTLALVLAQFGWIKRLRGARLLGLFAVYLFLAVIGALCDVAALIAMGELAPVLSVFVCILVAVHGTIVFGAARLFRFDLDTASVASQANIGGATSALALARSLGRGDLELPAILIGSVGLVLGNYLGFLMVALLGG
ncbi:MAG: DUF819 family protein [Woeseiaceae bacterium]|nr:DUF819 family protein [Woeseiaceae bacterium]